MESNVPMKLRATMRAIATIAICNLVATALIIVESFLTVRYAPWGRWAVDLSSLSSKDLAMKLGGPAVLLHRGLMLDLWVFGPAIALIVGLVAGLIYRRADWWISVLSIVVLVTIYSTPTSVMNISASLFYLALTWLVMRIVCGWHYANDYTKKAAASP